MLFAKRLAEQAAYAFVGAFAAAALVGDLGQAALVAAAVAGVRAVLGVLVKNFGEVESPNVK